MDLFFAGSGAREAFLFSPRALDDLRASDGAFTERFETAPLGKYEGAIEPGSDLYLYRVARRKSPAAVAAQRAGP